MPLTYSEKIRIVSKRRNITIAELATKIGTSRQNLTNKLSRNTFSENELTEIATALNCTFETIFIMNDTGEQI